MSNKFAGQQYEQNVVHVLRKSIVFGDATEKTTFSLGWLPPQAAVTHAGVTVLTAFNAGTNNRLDIGFRNGGNGETDDPNAWQTLLALGTPGVILDADLATAASTILPLGAEATFDLDLTSTAATTGRGVVWLYYVVDNDGDTGT